MRFKFEKFEKAERLGRNITETAEGRLATHNPNMIKIREKLMGKGSNKEDADKLRDTFKKYSSKKGYQDLWSNTISEGKGIFERAKDFISDGFKENIIDPLKKFMLGDKDDHTKFSFVDAAKKSFSDNIVNPLKKFFLGKDVDHTKFSFVDSVKKGWDRLIVFPLKKLIVGDPKKAAKLSFLKTIEYSWNKNVLFPFKTYLMGNKKEAGKTSFIQALGFKFN